MLQSIRVTRSRDACFFALDDGIVVGRDGHDIVRDQVWGAPDLVVEVLSPGIERYDRTEKLEWYRRYGVRECWLADLIEERVVVIDLTADPPAEKISRGAQCVQSSVMLDLIVPAYRLLS